MNCHVKCLLQCGIGNVNLCDLRHVLPQWRSKADDTLQLYIKTNNVFSKFHEGKEYEETITQMQIRHPVLIA